MFLSTEHMDTLQITENQEKANLKTILSPENVCAVSKLTGTRNQRHRECKGDDNQEGRSAQFHSCSSQTPCAAKEPNKTQPVLERLRQESQQFQASLGCTAWAACQPCIPRISARQITVMLFPSVACLPVPDIQVTTETSRLEPRMI